MAAFLHKPGLIDHQDTVAIAIAEHIKRARPEARAARLARVRELAEARNPTQRSTDKRLFLSKLEDDLERADFARHGWASALNARAICAFWEGMMPGVFDDPP